MSMGNMFVRNSPGRTGAIDIESLKDGLRQLEPTRQPTKIGVLREMLEVIEERLAYGVTYDRIATFLSEKTGVEFKPDPLKSMLSKLRKEAKQLGANRSPDMSDTGTSHSA